MKKLFALLLVLAIAITCLAGCVAPTATPDATPDATPAPTTPDTTPEDKLEVLEFTVMDNRRDYNNSEYTKYLLEEWGLKCTKVYEMASGDCAVGGGYEYYQLMFAGNNTPDWIPSWDFDWQDIDDPVKEIGDDGKLVNLLPYVEAGKLDNYINNVWGDMIYAWDSVKACLGSVETGNLYVLPVRNYEVAYYTWLYNKYYFETELNMEAPPTDLAEVIQIMKTFAAENEGCSAWLYDWGTSTDTTWGYKGYWGYYEREPIFNACGVRCTNSWQTHNGAPEYAPMAKGYLEAIVTYRDLMATKTIFAQASDSVDAGVGIYGNKQDALQNNGAIFAWDSFNGLADLNNKAQQGNPNYEWAVVPEDPTFEGLEPVAYNNMPFGWVGKVIGTTASEKLIERLIAFIDWAATSEGEMRQQFGIEGISYELVDGKVKFLKYYDNTYTPEMNSTVKKETVEYYKFGLEHKANYDFIEEYTVYESDTYQYQVDMYNKVMGMIKNGQCNYPGVWGNKETAAQAVGKTAEEMDAIESNIKSIVKKWYNDFYAGIVDADSYAQMRADVLDAGYVPLLAYKHKLLVAALKYTEN